jgi:hypothetical protein
LTDVPSETLILHTEIISLRLLCRVSNGPEVMRYLSQNIGEAQKIVASGPAAATIAIGRLDARLDRTTREEKRNKRVSDRSGTA